MLAIERGVMAESVISLQELELAFGEKKVLQGVDLEVKDDIRDIDNWRLQPK